jgi:GMP synthase-like glutamine amidotransferase
MKTLLTSRQHPCWQFYTSEMPEATALFIQNYLTDPPHLMATWLSEIGFEIEVIKAFAGEEIPERLPPHISALIPLGGAMGALDDVIAPWLAPERELIRRTVSEGIPVIGICLGAQLLGAALGGTVARLDSNEIGVYEISQVEPDAIMNVGAGTLSTQWHEDYVSVLPEGATLLAKSDTCPTQIFKVADLSYGIQCHPEADASIVALWEEKPDNAFKSFGLQKVSDSIREAEPTLAASWKPLIQSWGRAVMATSAGR